MRAILATVLCCLLPALAEAQVYECPGAGGVPTFQDTPCAGGKSVPIDPNVIDTGPAPSSGAAVPGQGTSGSPGDTGTTQVTGGGGGGGQSTLKGLVYKSIEFVTPEDMADVDLDADALPVKLRIEPALRPGDAIAVSWDGVVLPERRYEAQFEISRREWEAAAHDDQLHIMEVSIYAQDGRSLITSAPLRFHGRAERQIRRNVNRAAHHD